MSKEDIFYQAMLARDYRFDGKFFVGVKTTGIYCRPICPAKPKRENVEFFKTHIEAEKSGYRPCMRCRPESAPQSPAWIGKSAVVQRAVKILNSQDSIAFEENEFAERFGVTARHLRRLFVEEIGKTPKQLAFENRLNLARKLISETTLPVTEVAFAAGFSSIRRFNAAFKERFKKAPSEIRRKQKKSDENSPLAIRLSYRPPFDFSGLLSFYENHRVGDLEWYEDGKMFRVVEFNNKLGTVSISNDEKNCEVIVEVDFPDTSILHHLIPRIRNLFDLNSDPVLIANAIEKNPALKKILKKHPGLRMPTGWDPFEVAIGTILGQLVSVEFARTLMRDLIEIAGRETDLIANGKKIKLFPTSKEILKADLSKLKTTRVRKATLLAFCEAIENKELSLESTQDIETFMKKILSIKGIGPWTASYISLKALRDTDSFPATDLILARAVKIHPLKIINTMSPWRGYVAVLLWKHYWKTI